jgi:hypothetical protein
MSDERQLTLADYAREAHEEAERVKKTNRERRSRRSFIVFATDPARVGEDDYKLVFACEAHTQAEAERKIRRLTGRRRRVAAYLSSGKYKSELPEARWVAQVQDAM